MAIAATATREDKQKWLLRPFDWAWRLSFGVSFFGLFFFFEGKVPLGQLSGILLTALVIISCLLMWGVRRFLNATRGRS